MMPQSLFRYRKCDEERINAFENDTIFMVPPDWFNDPYDTLVRYDFEGIKKYVDTIASVEGLEQLKSFYEQGNDFPDELKRSFSKEYWDSLKEHVLNTSDFRSIESQIERNKQQLLALVSLYFPILSSFGKRFSHVACFTEDVQSILMWSHYADSHKGFALEYDFRPTLTNPLPRVGLYPVIYSEERYDASVYLTWALFTINGIKSMNPDIGASLKASLFKSKLWEYEKEWRMIDPGPHDLLNSSSTSIEYQPKAIYYGTNIPQDKLAQLHQIAQRKGIREFEMFIDYGASKYELKFRPFSSVRVLNVG